MTIAEELYADIINLPHHELATRQRMPLINRAASFSPFAALNGYDDAVKETGRLTDERIELGDEERDLLDRKQQYLQEIIADRPEITVTFFVPDEKKSGGSSADQPNWKIPGNRRRLELCGFPAW